MRRCSSQRLLLLAAVAAVCFGVAFALPAANSDRSSYAVLSAAADSGESSKQQLALLDELAGDANAASEAEEVYLPSAPTRGLYASAAPVGDQDEAVSSAHEFDVAAGGIRFAALMATGTGTASDASAASASADYAKRKAAYDATMNIRRAFSQFVNDAYADAERAGHDARAMIQSLETDDHSAGIIPKLLLQCQRDGPGFTEGRTNVQRKELWEKHFAEVRTTPEQAQHMGNFRQALVTNCPSADGVADPQCLSGWCYRATSVLRSLRAALTTAAVTSRSSDTGEAFDSIKFRRQVRGLIGQALGPQPAAPSPPAPPAASPPSSTGTGAPSDVFDPNQKIISK